MSEENVELTYRGIDAFNERDIDTSLALLDPEVEFTPYEIALQGGDPYRGHDGARKWLEDVLGAFPDFRLEVYTVQDLGDVTLIHGRLRGRGAGSGASFERTLWQPMKWRDKRVVWWCAFDREAEALEAAGLEK